MPAPNADSASRHGMVATHSLLTTRANGTLFITPERWIRYWLLPRNARSHKERLHRKSLMRHPKGSVANTMLCASTAGKNSRWTQLKLAPLAAANPRTHAGQWRLVVVGARSARRQNSLSSPSLEQFHEPARNSHHDRPGNVG